MMWGMSMIWRIDKYLASWRQGIASVNWNMDEDTCMRSCVGNLELVFYIIEKYMPEACGWEWI